MSPKLKALFFVLRVAILALNIWLCAVTFSAFAPTVEAVLKSFSLFPNLGAMIEKATPATYLIWMGWLYLAFKALITLLSTLEKLFKNQPY
ncbi:MAG: hypothetical protein UX26_C0002G0046 [Parcubacteria group bacterium GW2011_GWC1_45_9]|nr:MAG: hypothetical protein UW89_C0009G0004 [Parcubacteria group bacterium GW2011_GWB1_45_10]KKU17390.1 MAG: hypothetical protein UX26_C0002G0046 [Parcubacteria group bacterium GW2011_GWC1_45_9]HCI05366.1 hypothetical protein [Patescibacteria group bacterium]